MERKACSPMEFGSLGPVEARFYGGVSTWLASPRVCRLGGRGNGILVVIGI